MESSEYQNDWLTAGNLPLADPALIQRRMHFKRLTTNAAVMQERRKCFS